MHLDYKQPDFYHFSEDSTLLARVAAKTTLKASRVLDLCAGCGVVGIEFWNLCSNIDHITFIELQIEFKQSLEANIEKINDTEVNCLFNNFKEVSLKNKFDLILCNPPYFASEASRASLNENKNICRSMSISEMLELIDFIDSHLDDAGRAMLVLPLNNIYWDEVLKKSSRKKKIVEKNESVYILELF